ncbi:hypothetical protein D3C76_1489000 [compost metagenome]
MIIDAGDVERIKQVTATNIGIKRLLWHRLVVAVVYQDRRAVEAQEIPAAHIETQRMSQD